MRITLQIILLFISLTASAATTNKLQQKQFKNDIITIKDNLKKGKDLDKGEATIRKYLADSLHHDDISLHLLLTDVIRKQYEAGNEKMYLKTSTDTSGLVNTARKMFIAYQQLDSLDARPKKDSIIAPQYRQKNATFLEPYMDNLYKGGLYFYNHGNWQDAWNCFDTYLDARCQPLFKDTELDKSKIIDAAYFATMSATKLSELPLAKKYAIEALLMKDTKLSSLQILSDLCLQKKDTMDYVKYLAMGFHEDYSSQYFFPRLIDYYLDKNDYRTASIYADAALKHDSTNTLFLLAKHETLMMQRNYPAALDYGVKLLQHNDSIAVPNYNVGYIYYLKAQDAMKTPGLSYRKRMNNAQYWYKMCMPYMKRYRSQAPDEQKLWKPILYDVYLNLNMGKEFSEIEALK